MREIKVCQICGSDAKFMKDSKTHCNCSNKDCLLSGDKYFHVDKWNKRTSASVSSVEEMSKLIYRHMIGDDYIHFGDCTKEANSCMVCLSLNAAEAIHALLTEKK